MVYSFNNKARDINVKLSYILLFNINMSMYHISSIYVVKKSNLIVCHKKYERMAEKTPYQAIVVVQLGVGTSSKLRLLWSPPTAQSYAHETNEDARCEGAPHSAACWHQNCDFEKCRIKARKQNKIIEFGKSGQMRTLDLWLYGHLYFLLPFFTVRKNTERQHVVHLRRAFICRTHFKCLCSIKGQRDESHNKQASVCVYVCVCECVSVCRGDREEAIESREIKAGGALCFWISVWEV